jgi:hypothetical protein
MFLSLTVAMMFGSPADETKPTPPTKDVGAAVKILGRAPWRASAKPGSAAQQLVIRSEADFAKAVSPANDTKTVLDNLKKQLKVETIDWQKQMLIVASGGAQSTGGFRFEILGVFVKGDTMTVCWKLHAPKPTDFVTAAFTHPAETVLVETFPGKVVFDPPAAKEKQKPPAKRGADDSANPDSSDE